MRPSLRTRAPRLFTWLAGFLSGALVLLLVPTWPWAGFEERALSLLVGLQGPRPWNPDVRLLALDDETFIKLGRPLPRVNTARLLEALHAAGAGVVGFDIVYDPPAPDGPEADLRFRQALERHGRAVLPVDCVDTPLPAELETLARSVLAQRTLAVGPTPGTPCSSVVLPTPALRQVASAAHFLITRTPSGEVRGVFPFADFGNLRLPGLALASYLLARGLTLDDVEQGPDFVRVGGLEIPVGPRGELLASYRGLPDGSALSFVRLHEAVGPNEPPRFPPELAEFLRGKHLIVALTAKSAGDKGYFPGGALLPQATLHAAVLSDLLEGRPVRALGFGYQVLATLLASALLAWAAQFLSSWRSVLSVLATALALAAGASVLLGMGIHAPPVAPMTGAAVAWGVGTVLRLGSREEERRVLGEAFGAYVDPAVLARVLEDPRRYLAMGGAKRNLSILFSDISGFTALSNALPPDQVISLMREYLDTMISIITAEQGRVDKIMGDGILAVFGDPIPHDDHAIRAVRVGLAMQARMLELRRKWESQGVPRVGMRVGVATGEVYVGNIGAQHKKVEYTVLGRPVNLASRLENQAPTSGVLVSETTRAACADTYSFLRFTGLRIKGFSGEQSAYLVLGAATSEDSRRRHARLQAEGAVELSGRGQSAPARLENVSLGGLYVVSGLELDVGDVVDVRLLQGPVTPSIQGTVRHRTVRPDGALGYGVALTSEILRNAAHLVAALYGGAPHGGVAMQPGEHLRLELEPAPGGPMPSPAPAAEPTTSVPTVRPVPPAE